MTRTSPVSASVSNSFLLVVQNPTGSSSSLRRQVKPINRECDPEHGCTFDLINDS